MIASILAQQQSSKAVQLYPLAVIMLCCPPFLAFLAHRRRIAEGIRLRKPALVFCLINFYTLEASNAGHTTI